MKSELAVRLRDVRCLNRIGCKVAAQVASAPRYSADFQVPWRRGLPRRSLQRAQDFGVTLCRCREAQDVALRASPLQTATVRFAAVAARSDGRGAAAVGAARSSTPARRKACSIGTQSPGVHQAQQTDLQMQARLQRSLHVFKQFQR